MYLKLRLVSWEQFSAASTASVMPVPYLEPTWREIIQAQELE
jgi:hypothetical protein